MANCTVILGARPQFIKHQPLQALLQQHFQVRLLHTGQHYDKEMSEVFFQELELDPPDLLLEVGSASHGVQTGKMLTLIEQDLLEFPADFVIVYGDTNSTLAGALAAVKLHIPVVHIEAGLRSFNRQMPEEINRVVADRIADVLFTTSTLSQENLYQEGISQNVYVVGDIMFDALRFFLPAAQNRQKQILEQHRLSSQGYYLATIHRPANADSRDKLAAIIEAFSELPFPVVFPVHPRTAQRLKEFSLVLGENILALPPQGYLNNLALLCNARLALTDSGGLQKEAFYLQVPCLTIRPETEWTETVEQGWNVLVAAEKQAICQQVAKYKRPAVQQPVYGSGDTALKITEILTRIYSK